MMFKNKKWFVIGLVGALALTLGGMAFGFVGTASAAAAVDTGLFHGRGPGDLPGGEAGDDTYLADALGITVEDLQAAYQAAQAAGLEQAVADGLITQEEADQMAERGFFGRRGFGLHDSEIDFEALLADALGITVEDLDAAKDAAAAARLAQAVADGEVTEEEAAAIEANRALRNYIDKDELVAKALGITVEELQTAKDDGVRMPELLEQLGLTEEEFQTNMQTAREEMLQQAVADGVITQEQADLLLSGDFGMFDGHRPSGLRGPGGHGGDGGPGGHKRPGHSELPGGTDGTGIELPETPVNEG